MPAPTDPAVAWASICSLNFLVAPVYMLNRPTPSTTSPAMTTITTPAGCCSTVPVTLEAVSPSDVCPPAAKRPAVTDSAR